MGLPGGPEPLEVLRRRLAPPGRFNGLPWGLRLEAENAPTGRRHRGHLSVSSAARAGKMG